MLDPVETVGFLEASYSSGSLRWEGMLTAQYRCALPHPRTLVDVGAHHGLHVAHFLDMGARHVEAFEPIPELCTGLVQRLGCDRLAVHQIALGDRAGRSVFLIDQTTPSESGLRARADKVGQRDFLPIDVEVGTLDQFRFRDVDYIKLDAEGAELTVLGGAEATLTAWRPLLSVEYGWAGYHPYGLSKRSLLDWATAHRYVVCDLFGSPLTDAYDACVDRYYWDFLVVPDEAADLRRRLADNGAALLADIERFRV